MLETKPRFWCSRKGTVKLYSHCNLWYSLLPKASQSSISLYLNSSYTEDNQGHGTRSCREFQTRGLIYLEIIREVDRGMSLEYSPQIIVDVAPVGVV